MDIKKGSTVALIGKSGSGKSTVIDIVSGLLSPKSGSVTIAGKTLTPKNIGNWQAQIGYVPQRIYLLDDTIEANIVFGSKAEPVDHARLKQVSRVAQIDEFIENSLPDGYQTLVGENGARLSGGQRQRIGIARALYRRPSLLILDEATGALDADMDSKVMNGIRDYDRDLTILVVTHHIERLTFCDQVVSVDESGAS